MRHNLIYLLIITFFLVSCNITIISPTPTLIKPTATVRPTSTLWPTSTDLPTLTPTPTPIPLLTETSCRPTANPFPTQIPNGNYLFYENFSIGKVCSFSGEIKKGQSFQKKITEGLFFCIISISNYLGENHGWYIKISDEVGEVCDDDFTAIYPPSYGGDPQTHIEGVQFTNENKSVFTHSFVREFDFVFNQRDYEALLDSYYSVSLDKKADLTKIKNSRGIFTIQELKLGNPIPNEEPWIESMKFEVKIYLPSD